MGKEKPAEALGLRPCRAPRPSPQAPSVLPRDALPAALPSLGSRPCHLPFCPRQVISPLCRRSSLPAQRKTAETPPGRGAVGPGHPRLPRPGSDTIGKHSLSVNTRAAGLQGSFSSAHLPTPPGSPGKLGRPSTEGTTSRPVLPMTRFWSLQVAAPQCRPSSQTNSRCSRAPSDPPEARPAEPPKPCRRACGETRGTAARTSARLPSGPCKGTSGPRRGRCAASLARLGGLKRRAPPPESPSRSADRGVPFGVRVDALPPGRSCTAGRGFERAGPRRRGSGHGSAGRTRLRARRPQRPAPSERSDFPACRLLVPATPAGPAQRGARRPSGGMGARLTLVNLTSRFRTGRGRAGGFLSGCPFSTAPLVVAMALLRSPARGARVCGAGSRPDGAQPARGVTAPRRFMERPTPPAQGGRLIGCRTGGREGGREGRGPACLTPPRPPPLREPGHRAARSPAPRRLPLEELPRSAAGPRKCQGSGSGPG